MQHNYRNILIIKPSALGDIVHALPVLQSLRSALPAARITWLVRREFAPLLACVDGLDEVLLFDRRQLGRWYCNPRSFNALLAFMHTLKATRYDLVLDLQGLFRTAFFARLTGCRSRFGMADCRECAGLFYTHNVPRPSHSVHVLDYYHAMLAAAGLDTALPHDVTFQVPPDAAAAVAQKLSHAGADKHYFVLIPSSAHTSKCWPSERFARLAEKIHSEYGLSIVLVGTENDRPIIDAIKAQCRVPVIDMAEKTTLCELIALLKNCRGVVSNDTGPGYIAATMHVPTVMIFGHTNPMRIMPYGHFEYVVAVDPDKRPETIESPDPAFRIEQVPFEWVYEKIAAQLNAASHKQ